MIRFPIFLATLAFTAPAIAFDDLYRDLSIMAVDEASNSPAFSYAAPDRTVPPEHTQYPANSNLAGAIYGLRNATQVTGIEFGKVIAAFEAGSPPDALTILHGQSGFADHTPDALIPRDYTASTIEGVEVLSRGEDFKMSIMDREPEDPFDGGMGRSYRLARTDDTVVVTFSTGTMERTLAALASPESCTGCVPWRSMLDTVKAAAGADATLVAAAGYPVGVFNSPREGTERSTTLPPYSFMMYAMTTGSGPDIHLSLYFPDDASAQTGGKSIASAMEALFADLHEADGTSADAGAMLSVDGPIATVSIDFTDPVIANRAYYRMLQRTFRGEFGELAPAS
jgi:hypothetical protein